MTYFFTGTGEQGLVMYLDRICFFKEEKLLANRFSTR
jgi:hypothetical protein